MVTWRGWGLLVLVIGLVPFIYTVPFALGPEPATPGGEPPSVTGYFVAPLLVSAGLNFGLALFLARTRGDRRHDFMGVTVAAWTWVFLALAPIVAGIWLHETL